MTKDLTPITLLGKTVAFLVAPEGTERIELTDPWQAVREAGGIPRLLCTRPGRIQVFDGLNRADVPVEAVTVDEVVGASPATRYDALVLPGGVAGPDALRTDARAVAFVREFFDSGRPVAAVGHAAWTLVEADAVRGRTLTSWPSLRTDIRNAGGGWVDEAVVVCRDGPNVLVTSRNPDDLPLFDDAFVTAVARAGAAEGVARSGRGLRARGARMPWIGRRRRTGRRTTSGVRW